LLDFDAVKWCRRLLLILTLVFGTSCVAAAPKQASKIDTEAQFSEMARINSGGRYASFPQLMFVIDRGAGSNPVLHFVNSKYYEYHIDFIQRTYLSTQTIEQLDKVSYSDPNRRFILGSVVRYPTLEKYGIEFWEGDALTPAILETAFNSLQQNFPKPLSFKPNSQPQFDLAKSIAGLPLIDGNQIYGSRTSLVLNAGRATGKLKILDKIDDDTIIRRDDILILNETPLRLNPVAAIVTTEFSTPLSHVNLLAKSWRIPSGYLRDANRTYAGLNGKWVTLSAKGEAITIRSASAKEIARAKKQSGTKKVQVAAADLVYRALPALTEQSAKDVIRTGAKAANLGVVALKSMRLETGFSVPAGFSIPFSYYDDFVRANGLDTRIVAMLADNELRDNAKKRKAALAELRSAFAAGKLDQSLLDSAMKRREVVIGNGSVFARSSTNSEDLPGFNGAGLYSSVPNVTDAASLESAIKTVWGSVWNDAAFEAREAAGIDHQSVKASVLIQRGMNATASGVMITENPFEPSELGAIFINAKRGLGIRVVEGRKVAEQLLYRKEPESIQLLTRSNDDAMLSFDENGGVKEIQIEPGRLVLTDEKARKLARAGQIIEDYFGGKPQDIEWLFIDETLYIVQSRPYIRGD
jgi:rifampicin phosphotransferase